MSAIAQLGAALAAPDADADALLRDFVARNRFPLLDGSTATFFFWDGAPIYKVFLLHWVHGLESRQEFQRIPGTEAMFLSVELPLRGRVEYKLEVQRNHETYWIRDPLNSRLARDPFGANSVLPMTGYTEPGWVFAEPGVRQGRRGGLRPAL